MAVALADRPDLRAAPPVATALSPRGESLADLWSAYLAEWRKMDATPADQDPDDTRFLALGDEIAATPATTLEEVAIKLRVLCCTHDEDCGALAHYANGEPVDEDRMTLMPDELWAAWDALQDLERILRARA